MMTTVMIGVDLAKNAFQVHGASMTGQVKFRKKLSRRQFHKFMADHPACVVVLEACGGARYWAREMIRLGHEVKLIAPQYVKPFVKRQSETEQKTIRGIVFPSNRRGGRGSNRDCGTAP